VFYQKTPADIMVFKGTVFRYNKGMSLSSSETAVRKQRLAEAINLQQIESNPLSEEDIAMFEMFEHEGWSFEKRLEYIKSGYIKGDKTLPHNGK
jgi:hypothetical protein